MPHIDPLPRERLDMTDEAIAGLEALLGFVPRSTMTMARVPGLAPAFQELGRVVMTSPLVDRTLMLLVAQVASSAAGCRYCQAHTGHAAERAGVDEAKVEALWSFETDDRFSEAERAALRLARDAAQVPNATSGEHFAALRPHFDDDQITVLVAVISLYGFLNRWNDTMATELEDSPASFGERSLAPQGWSIDKHA
ncbi:MAG: carboxymuconolactone decarboxylase family protein [Actinomycetota bacterium]